MKLDYLILRLLRHFMPESAARFLLKHRLVIRPGLESSDPSAAVEQYIQGLATYGKSIQDKRILVFGYGGRFAVGVELLRRGAAHVVLCDHFVLLDKERNLDLFPGYSDYLVLANEEVKPNPEFLTFLHGDIREEKIQKQVSQVDCVFSTSVYEHLDDVNGVTRALAKLISPAGLHLHFVDLRDHYFKYPFEMLTFSERVWKNFLNPTSNLNRYRLTNYQEVFDSYFQKVNISVLDRQEEKFHIARSRIRSEFLSGHQDVDSVTLIQVLAELPKHL